MTRGSMADRLATEFTKPFESPSAAPPLLAVLIELVVDADDKHVCLVGEVVAMLGTLCITSIDISNRNALYLEDAG